MFAGTCPRLAIEKHVVDRAAVFFDANKFLKGKVGFPEAIDNREMFLARFGVKTGDNRLHEDPFLSDIFRQVADDFEGFPRLRQDVDTKQWYLATCIGRSVVHVVE